MKPSVINLSALLVLLIAGLVGAIFSMKSNEKEEDRAALTQDHIAEEDKLKEQEKEPEESALNSQEVAQDTRANAHMRPPEDPAIRAPEQEIQKTDNSPASEALQQHVVALYGDLFKELNLPAEQQQKLNAHLSKTMRSQAELGPLMFDPNIPVEDVLKRQEKLVQEQSAELGGILAPQEQEILKQYQDNLPKKMQAQQVDGLVEQLGLSGADKENTQRVIKRAMENIQPQNTKGKISREEILDLRAKFAGKKMGGAEFTEAGMKAGAENLNKFLKNIEKDLPRDHYEKIKEQLEMPMKMMNQKGNMP